VPGFFLPGRGAAAGWRDRFDGGPTDLANKRKHRDRGRAADDAGAPPPRAPDAGPEGPPRSRARLWIFRLVLLATPLLLLGLAETALRIAGFGHDLEPLFMASPQQPQYLQANPRAVLRLFVDPRQAPSVSIETAYFRRDKAPGTFRVFVQGESSAAGFPYGLGASLAGVLDQRFERAFPSREVEVISTAMAAVNSYALLDFADEILAQQPDAIVIYVGHNEFLGVLGVGSSLRMAGSPSLTRLYLAAREWRLFQAMARLIGATGVRGDVAATGSSDTLMARVAGDRSIPLDSALFRRGEDQFSGNLDALLGRYARAGVPVFVGTLVSNERDQEPLAVLAEVPGDATGAARTAWHAAQDTEAAGNLDAARDGYAWARDLDPLRFRAPAVFSSIVGAAAARHGAELVAARDRFVDASPNGLVGASLLLEHVHPNLDGYFLLADAFFDAMIARGIPGTPEVVVDDATARAEMPVSDIDRWLGEFKVRRVRSAWPFTTQSTRPELPAPASEGERLAQEVYFERLSWPEAQDRLRQHYRATGNTAEFIRTTAILADAFPFAGSLQFESAAALIDGGRPADAWRYAERAIALQPNDVNALLVGAHAQLLTGRREAGRELLQRVLAIEPGNATARRVLEETELQPPAP
jgi:tetratricopeptide (TPR) repeat protein